VTVFDINECDGRLYMTMQFVDGIDLRSRLARDGRLAPAAAGEITRQIASALDAASRGGLVHRDVKPGNILIAGDPPTGQAFLSDFGVSRRSASPSELTLPGTVVGTVAYSAPEQLMGSDVDHRSDIYALGCVLFEMVTGRKPYQGATSTAVALAHIQAPVPSAHEIVHQLPSALDHVLAKAMAKDPNERYHSAGGFAQAAMTALHQAEETGAHDPLSSGEGDTTKISPALVVEDATRPLPSAPSPPDMHSERISPAGVAIDAEPGRLAVARPRRDRGVLVAQLLALAACVAVVALARWPQSFISYGNGLESLWDATRSGGDPTSPLRAVDFRNLVLLVATAFVLIGLSLGVLRRTLSSAATVVAVLVIAQLLRFWRGFGPQWNATHTVGAAYWLALAAAVIIALGAATAAVAPSAPVRPDR
jgi:hypothetical protein